jgi:hypothetical protein
VSGEEQTQPPVVEQRSSVKIATTAKGEATVEVKVVEGALTGEVERIRQLAVRSYLDAMREVRQP